MYFSGNGVTQDYVQAYMWQTLGMASYRASDSAKRDAASKHRDQIAAKMTPEQIAEAQQLAKDWVSK
jgi:hypothetical protein